jgi:nucleotide-binding universal stress UspA family protein
LPYKRILVPYDGSKAADKALDHAVGLAADFKGSPEIILLNVIETILLPPRAGDAESSVTHEMVSPEVLRKEMYLSLKSHAKRMLSEKAREASHAGLKVSTEVKYGYAADEIVRLAREEQVDIIVIGNVGLRGISKIRILGSVSRSVAERAACPVMIIH